MRCYLERREGSPNWYIHQYDERTGQVRRVSTRTTDRGLAERKLAEHVIRLPQQQVLNDATLVHIILRYWEHHGKTRFSKDTVRRVMGLVVEHEPDTRVYRWDLPRQKLFASKCGKTSSTQRRYMGVMRAALQWAFDNGEIPVMPAVYKVSAQDAAGVTPFTVLELANLFESCRHEHERRLLLLCLASAARPGSVLDLTWDRIDFETGVVDFAVPGRRLTKKRRAKVPLAATALAYLEPRRVLGPVVHWNLKRLKGHKMTFGRIAERAGIEGTAYGIRKAVSIWLRKDGVPEWDIKGMLGHALGGETERYAHYRPEYMRAAAASVERLIREICPGWLASYLPAPIDVISERPQVLVMNGDFGARDRDRTCDPYHVKVLIDKGFQDLTASNDD